MKSKYKLYEWAGFRKLFIAFSKLISSSEQYGDKQWQLEILSRESTEGLQCTAGSICSKVSEIWARRARWNTWKKGVSGDSLAIFLIFSLHVTLWGMRTSASNQINLKKKKREKKGEESTSPSLGCRKHLAGRECNIKCLKWKQILVMVAACPQVWE